MQDVCLPISGNQVQRAGNADGFFIEIDGKHIVPHKIGLFRYALRRREPFALREPSFAANIFPYFEDAVDGKAGAAAGGVDDFVAHGRIHHLHAHINHIPRREILALFALLCLAHQVFKGIVNHIQVIIEQLDILKRGNTDGKMRRREQNLAFLRKNTLPFPLGIIKQALNFLFQLIICFAGIPEL